MSTIVFIAAFPEEVEAVKKALGDKYPILMSGMGPIPAMIATIAAIDKYSPELIVEVGIGGATNNDLKIGEVVVVSSDYQIDLGAYRPDTKTFDPFTTEHYKSDYQIEGLKSVSGQTVTTACTPLIESTAQVESMEGAAFMAAAQYKGVKFVQIRSISNYTGQSRAEWREEEALVNLSNTLAQHF